MYLLTLKLLIFFFFFTFSKSLIPSIAILVLFGPSNENGVQTTPTCYSIKLNFWFILTVKIPFFFASIPITEVAPVPLCFNKFLIFYLPVPPPIPTIF